MKEITLKKHHANSKLATSFGIIAVGPDCKAQVNDEQLKAFEAAGMIESHGSVVADKPKKEEKPADKDPLDELGEMSKQSKKGKK